MDKKIPGIGLFGGSFDPVHKGHISIAESFLASDYISELWILLTPDPPHKAGHKLARYGIRMSMLKAAFDEMENVHIRNIENQLPQPSYTVRTLRHFHKKYLRKPFYLCLGEDSVRNFDKWKNWKEILSYCDLLAAHRPTGDNLPSLPDEIGAQTHFVQHDPIDVSSTDIRNYLARDEPISDLVPPGVEEIIRREGLYR